MRLSDFLWSDEEVARLKQRRADGLSFRQIAAEMRLTRNAVIGKAQRLGMSSKQVGPRSPAEVIGEAVERVRKRSIRPRAMPEPEPPTQAVELPPEAFPHACTLLELEPASCRWPVGEAPWLFCGATRMADSSYCERHHRMGHTHTSGRTTIPLAWRAA